EPMCASSRRASPEYLPRAIVDAGNRWWCGHSGKVARRLARSISTCREPVASSPATLTSSANFLARFARRSLTEFDETRCDAAARGGPIPHVGVATGDRGVRDGTDASRIEHAEPSFRSASAAYDWDRLERAVRALVAQQETLQRELRALR